MGKVALVLGLGIVLIGSTATWALTRPLRDRVSATASRHPVCSDPNQPIAVFLNNKSFSTVTRVSFSVELKRKGYSSVLAQNMHEIDKIMPRGAEEVFCVGRPTQALDIPGYEKVVPEQENIPESEAEYSVDVVTASSD